MDLITEARTKRQEAIKVHPKAKGRTKRLTRATGLTGPERALIQAALDAN